MATSLSAAILTPTDNLPERIREINNDFHHLLPRFRHGKVSTEVFGKSRLGTTISGRAIEFEEARDASKKPQAATLGVRGQRPKVGSEASLRQAQPQAQKEEVRSARSRKRSK